MLTCGYVGRNIDSVDPIEWYRAECFRQKCEYTMSVKYAILGFLSWQPLAGYDLKKIFADSPFIHWSGNNNQIYRTLLDLHQAGHVENEVILPESGPARKVYSITEPGRAALHNWLLSAPEAPQHRNEFLVQLAWADVLSPQELALLVAGYIHAVEVNLLVAQEERRRRRVNPARSEREALLWSAIHDNRSGYFEHELAWARRLQAELEAEQARTSGT